MDDNTFTCQYEQSFSGLMISALIVGLIVVGAGPQKLQWLNDFYHLLMPENLIIYVGNKNHGYILDCCFSNSFKKKGPYDKSPYDKCGKMCENLLFIICIKCLLSTSCDVARLLIILLQFLLLFYFKYNYYRCYSKYY